MGRSRPFRGKNGRKTGEREKINIYMWIKFASLNVNGLRATVDGIPKRRKLFTWLKGLNLDVIFLQETHCDSDFERIVRSEWGGKCFFAHGNSRSRGVATMFNPRGFMDATEVRSCPDGRFIVVKVEVNRTALLLANVYGPNHDDPTTFQNLFHECEEMNSELVILGGDWNFVLNVKLDRLTTAQRVANNHRCKNIATCFMQHKNIIDI